MNKLIATLVAATFAMGSAFAQTSVPTAAPMAPTAMGAGLSIEATHRGGKKHKHSKKKHKKHKKPAKTTGAPK